LFTGEDTLRVSKIFLIVSFGLIPWSINQIVTRSYYVQRNYWFPVWVGTSITLVTVILLKLNSAPTEANYAGIIISSLWLNMLVLTFFLKVKEERIVNKSQMLDFLKIFLVGTAVYFLTTAINIYSGNLIFEVIIDSLFILILIFLSLFLVKMKYVNLKRIR
jgi:peptidoglycan biosynthesis protein MviN/MurJ (putative lipid II flippase)